jgi:hypothetical protein
MTWTAGPSPSISIRHETSFFLPRFGICGKNFFENSAEAHLTTGLEARARSVSLSFSALAFLQTSFYIKNKTISLLFLK